MMEVVKAKILKLLDVGVIYPITDSKWVAPIHVVPKRTGITLVKKKMMNSFLLASQVDGECVTTRLFQAQNNSKFFFYIYIYT